MRGFLIGMVLIVLLITSVLSLRPGGLRNQFRNIGRRLKLALALAGIYMVVSAAFRLALPNQAAGEVGTALVGLVLAIIFIVLSPDRPLQS
jgi:hypothetical protein